MFRKIALFVVIVLGIAHAQAPSISRGHKNPGESLHYYVSFVGNPKLSSVSLFFQMAEQPKPNQVGLQTGFPIEQWKPFSPGVVEVSGTVPANAASGSYQLARFDVVTGTAPLEASKRYNYPADFKDNINFDIVNDASVNFPTIKSITPEPPKQ